MTQEVRKYTPFADMGSVLTYNEQLGDYILTEMASGRKLEDICNEPGMPDLITVYMWAQHNHFGFGDRYKQATRIRYSRMADEILDIADDTTNDWMTARNGAVIPNKELVARSRLRISTRQWLLSKHLPDLYGEKNEVTVNSKLNGQSAETIIPHDPVDAAKAYQQLMNTPPTQAPLTIEHDPMANGD